MRISDWSSDVCSSDLFNAINLALDAGWRFEGLPDAYYEDWLSVAQDEARHFAMLRARLQSLGYDYGDFTAHNGLWEAAESTAHDVLLRMTLDRKSTRLNSSH